MPDTDVPEADVAVIARQRQNRFLAVALPLYVLAFPLGFLIGVLAVDGWTDERSAVFWGVLAAITLLPLVLVLGLLWARRRGARWIQPPLALGLDRAERKHLAKAIQANRPVEEHAEVARDMARRTVRMQWTWRWLPILMIFVCATRLLSEPSRFDFLTIGGTILMLGTVPFIRRDVRRAQRWLDQHGS